MLRPITAALRSAYPARTAAAAQRLLSSTVMRLLSRRWRPCAWVQAQHAFWWYYIVRKIKFSASITIVNNPKPKKAGAAEPEGSEGSGDEREAAARPHPAGVPSSAAST